MQVPLKTSVQLGFLHATWLGQQLARTSLLRWYLAWSSERLGKKYDSTESGSLIAHFIQVPAIGLGVKSRLLVHNHSFFPSPLTDNLHTFDRGIRSAGRHSDYLRMGDSVQ